MMVRSAPLDGAERTGGQLQDPTLMLAAKLKQAV